MVTYMKHLKEQLILANKYFKENIFKLFVILLICFFAVGVISYFAMISMPQYAADFYDYISEIMDSSGAIKEDGSISAVGIFINNLRASVFTYLYGFVPFVFLPVWAMIMNSSIVGIMLGIVDVVSAESVLMTIIKFLLPHGIFEIPSLILSTSLGTKLCFIICKKIFGKAKDEKLLFHLKNYFRICIFYLLPLLIIAAFIEGVILPKIFM